jgi:hypothetical protein
MEDSAAASTRSTTGEEGATPAASGPNMKMKLKPRAEPKNGSNNVGGTKTSSKLGAKLNDAFERLVATLGYDPTLEGESDALAMDEEEEEPIVLVEKKTKKQLTKKKTTTAFKAHAGQDDDQSTVGEMAAAGDGGLAAGLQALAKQLHSIGHTDVTPFAESEAQYDVDIDDFDLCEEVVSSEEADQSTAAAVAAAVSTSAAPAQRGTPPPPPSSPKFANEIGATRSF